MKLNLLASASLALALAACGGGDDPATPTAAAPLADSADFKPLAVTPDLMFDLLPAVAARLRLAMDERVRSDYGELTEPVVEPERRSADGQWAFGGGYFPIPVASGHAGPVTALFVARRVSGRWEVTLEGDPGFDELLASAPPELTSGTERQLFASRADHLRGSLAVANGGRDTGLSLPYKRDDPSWGMWGIHGDGGNTRPFNAIDFMAGDARVLASRDGVAYKFCSNSRSAFIKVVHDNGYTTGYYHLRNQPQITSGQRVREGDFLGNIGTELPCGGSANGNHVHWTLWRGGQNGGPEPVNGKTIGGWTFYEGGQAYGGHAEHGNRSVGYNDRGLVNYGHDAAPQDGPIKPPPSSQPAPNPAPPVTGQPSGATTYQGSLGAEGLTAVHPAENGFTYGGGVLKGQLQAPKGSVYTLILGHYNASTGQWDKAAVSEGAAPHVEARVPAGRYRWRIDARSGHGPYTLQTQR